MLQKAIHNSVEQILDEKIVQINALTGGDINSVSKITTPQSSYVIKVNNNSVAHTMFTAEERGLQALASSNTFKIPEVIAVGEENKTAFILMEYIAAKPKVKNHDVEFGRMLAELHKNTAAKFGFANDNFIGTLPQYNQQLDKATDFYIQMRLMPQLEMAAKNGFTFNLGSFFKNLTSLIPEEPPALVHGDLWSGNAITDSNGLPCLIDPAVFYGHRETDLAMMQLFGGFGNQIFNSYQNHYPLEKNWHRRIDIWQLYYLLVHLNLFGSSYYGSVKTIIEKYA